MGLGLLAGQSPGGSAAPELGQSSFQGLPHSLTTQGLLGFSVLLGATTAGLHTKGNCGKEAPGLIGKVS